MITIRELMYGFEQLNLRDRPVVAHGSFKSLGAVLGGPKAVIDALLASTGALMMPAFTYETMVFPRVGPPNNGMEYPPRSRHAGDARMDDSAPLPFRRNMPVDREIGILPETLRRNPRAARSLHPILSFTGANADFALERQSLLDPLAPIGALLERDGWVVLIGVDHSVNTSIHLAEKLAGRKQFVRWAATTRRVVECPGFPGDSDGFRPIAEHLRAETRAVTVGEARVEAVPLRGLIETAQRLIKQNPLALLCQRANCERCNAVRASV